MPFDAVTLAAKKRDRLAALVDDFDIVDARAPGELPLVRTRRQDFAEARRRRELMAAPEATVFKL